MRRRSALLVLLALLAATPSSAAWPAGGKLVSSPGDINGVLHARITELPSGDLFVLGVGIGGNNNTFNIQRLTHGGLFHPGWPAIGVQLSSVPKGTSVRSQSVVVDEFARTWHTWSTANSLLENVGGDGSRLPVTGSYFVGSSAGGPTHAAPAPGGDMYVTSGSNRIKRMTPGGTPGAGWLMAGLSLPGTGFHDNAIIPDGSNGVIVFMRVGNPSGLPTALRILPNATVAPGWSTLGLTLSTVAPSFTDVGPFDSQVLPSGSGRWLALWSLDAGSGTRRLVMQRFQNDGTLDPAWPVDGIEVVAPDTIDACRALPDGAGGVYIIRLNNHHPVGTHISSAGAVIGTADTDLLDAAAQYMPTRPGPGASPLNIPEELIADVTDDGGLLVGWSDTRLAPTVTFRLRWLTPTLAPAPGKPADGLVFTPASPNAFAGAMLAVHADGPSGAYMAWSDYHSIGFDQFYGDVWMGYAQAPTTAGVGNVPRAVQLSAPRPNPAIGSVVLDLTLPDDAGAKVELMDIAGRVMRAQSVAGAGPHSISFDALGALAPGLYFARATSRGHSTTVRVVVSR